MRIFRVGLLRLFLIIFATHFLSNAAIAQTSALKSFDNSTSGAGPKSQLVQGPDGTLYGTTTEGPGSDHSGTVFRLQPDGSDFAILKSFVPAEGVHPIGGLTLFDDVLYGTTELGGSGGQGTVFKVNTDGTGFAVLKEFSARTTDPSTGLDVNTDGAQPQSSLTFYGGVLYGTALAGGNWGGGTIFKLNTDGADFTVLKNFTNTDGRLPATGLTLSGNVFYGTTWSGGNFSRGTVFRINTDGTGHTVLRHLIDSDGRFPNGNLTLSGSTLYGTTIGGGLRQQGVVFSLNTDGAGFKVLKNFSRVPPTGPQINTDGAQPYAPLTLSGNLLYGTTTVGGRSGAGTIFQMNTDGTDYVVLKEFTDSEGAYPFAGLTLSSNIFYGTTWLGGASSLGTVFKLDLATILTIHPLGSAVVLKWLDPTFSLQAAPTVGGVYTNIPEALSAYTNSTSEPQRFFRIKKN